MLRVFLITSLFFSVSVATHAGPLDSGIEYAEFCKNNLPREETTGQLLCLGIFIGTKGGYNYGFTGGIVYPHTRDSLDSMEVDAMMEQMAVVGKAAGSGAIDGYCPRQGSTHGEEVSMVVREIIGQKRLHSIPVSAAIMQAMASIMPCKKS